MNTPETRTCIRLLKQQHRRNGDTHAVKVYIQCIRQMVAMAGIKLEDAARMVAHEAPATALVVMDRVGLHPSSEPELLALQKVWPSS